MQLSLTDLTNKLNNLRVGKVIDCEIEAVVYKVFKISDNKFEITIDGKLIKVTIKALISLIQGSKFLDEIIKK